MATGDMLGIATSGLLAFQRALTTTGNNIANANTPGYSRQQVVLNTQNPVPSGSGFIGTGVQVTTVRRMYDQFLTAQVQSTTSSSSQLSTYQDMANRIANLVGDTTAGLSPNLDSFFSAVQGVASDPTGIPSRQVMLGAGQSLVSNFHSLSQQLDSMRSSINGQLQATANQVNSLASSIASINKNIVTASGQAGGQPPNDLLDQRDELVRQLSQLVSVNTVTQSDGTLNVFIGNGQSLVTGYSAGTLSATPNQYDASTMDISFKAGSSSSSADITSSITGGTLGGLLNVRSQVLDPAQNALGRVAIGLGMNFNAQNASGMDLKGNINQTFFNDLSTSGQALASSKNTGDYQLGVTVTSPSNLTTSNYQLSYDGTNYTLKDLSTNSVVGTYGSLPAVVAQAGFTLAKTSGTTIAAGDTFLIQPTRAAARDIGMTATDPTQIAAALPITMNGSTDAQGTPTNSGSGALTPVQVINTTSLPLSAPTTFTYNSTTKQFSYTGAASGTFNYDPSTDSGKTFTVLGVQVKMTGTPANGDSFVLANNTTQGVGDNTNALLLAGLQNQATLSGGTASYQQAYAQMVSDVGAKAQQAQTNYNTQNTLLQQAQSARDSVSGVNLDEEAASLVKYQQAYQAAAQVVTVANSVFQTLLTAVK